MENKIPINRLSKFFSEEDFFFTYKIRRRISSWRY